MPARKPACNAARRRPSPPRVLPSRDDAGAARSPSSDNIDLASMVNDMIRSSKQRRDARRSTLRIDYQQRLSEARGNITSMFSDHDKKAQKIRLRKVQRLVDLLKRKDDIERRMANSVKTLERAYQAHTTELKIALDARVAELR